jgi:hypothetical protein
MSSEVAKKRGRPKKVISDPVEVDVPDTKKSTTRAKSTKAAPKVVKPSVAPPPKPIMAEKAVPKPVTKPAVPPKAASPPPAPAKVAPSIPTAAPAKTNSKTPATPETSKILSKVRELSAKSVPSPEHTTKSSRPSATPTTSKPSQPKVVPSQAPKPHPSTFKPPPSSPPPSAAAAKPIAKPHVPIAALNSAIVSNITTRAGARPNTSGSKQLPNNYNSVAKKVTLAIVALPVAIVTSWVLYERCKYPFPFASLGGELKPNNNTVVLGEERKLLVKPGLAMVEAPVSKAEETSSGS